MTRKGCHVRSGCGDTVLPMSQLEMTHGPDDVRVDPPFHADEATMLTAWLDFHRGTLERKIAGVPPERLAERTAPPSSLSLLGLVRHLAEVEAQWFRAVLGGEAVPDRYVTGASPDGDFDDTDGADPAADLRTWRAEVEHSRARVAGLSMDTVSVGLRHGQPVSLRWIMVHLVEEYARHNGHADLLRERLDGVVGE